MAINQITGRQMVGAAALAGTILLGGLLSGCGGGDGAAPDRQAGQGVAVGEPNGAMPVMSDFVAKAQEATCADQRNRLFMIDKRMVYWDRAGTCPDNAYAHTLFGSTVQSVLCTTADAIGGARTTCADESSRALFNTIEANRDKADLGLGAGHQVEPIAVPPRVGAPVTFNLLDQGTHSGVQAAQAVTVRDASAFAALWTAHAGNNVVWPAIDFTRSMVIGVFMGTQPNGCYATNIDSVSRAGDKLLVQYTDSSPGPNAVCTQALTAPAHIVLAERSELPVEFVVQRKTIS